MIPCPQLEKCSGAGVAEEGGKAGGIDVVSAVETHVAHFTGNENVIGAAKTMRCP